MLNNCLELIGFITGTLLSLQQWRSWKILASGKNCTFLPGKQLLVITLSFKWPCHRSLTIVLGCVSSHYSFLFIWLNYIKILFYYHSWSAFFSIKGDRFFVSRTLMNHLLLDSYISLYYFPFVYDGTMHLHLFIIEPW